MENPAELEKMVPPNLRKWCRAEIWVDKEAIKRNVFWDDFNVDLRETGRGVPYLSEADGLTSGAWRRMYKRMPQDLLEAWAELLPESVESISTKNVRLRCAHPRPRLHGEEKRGFGSLETPPLSDAERSSDGIDNPFLMTPPPHPTPTPPVSFGIGSRSYRTLLWDRFDMDHDHKISAHEIDDALKSIEGKLCKQSQEDIERLREQFLRTRWLEDRFKPELSPQSDLSSNTSPPRPSQPSPLSSSL